MEEECDGEVRGGERERERRMIKERRVGTKCASMCKLPFNQTILHNGRRHLSHVSGGILQLGHIIPLVSRPYLLTLLDGPRADWRRSFWSVRLILRGEDDENFFQWFVKRKKKKLHFSRKMVTRLRRGNSLWLVGSIILAGWLRSGERKG